MAALRRREMEDHKGVSCGSQSSALASSDLACSLEGDMLSKEDTTAQVIATATDVTPSSRLSTTH